MKLWLINRTDSVDWEEWHSFVIRAETEQQVRDIAMKYVVESDFHEVSENHKRIWREDADVTEIVVAGEAGVVHGSYNNG